MSNHDEDHFDDGCCICSCPECTVVRADLRGAEICICSGCDSDSCGLHIGPTSPDPILNAFAVHLIDSGLQGCGPIVAVREYIAWSSSPVGTTGDQE